VSAAIDGPRWLAAIAAVERTLARRLPERSAQWGSLLNALAVQVEATDPDPRVVAAAAQALRALLEAWGVDLRQGDLEARLAAVVNARVTWPPLKEYPTWSLGPTALAEVAHLRYELGLSVAHVHRHFRQHLGACMPHASLLRDIAATPPPAPSRRARRR
jgi:hypothetical protein